MNPLLIILGAVFGALLILGVGFAVATMFLTVWDFMVWAGVLLSCFLLGYKGYPRVVFLVPPFFGAIIMVLAHRVTGMFTLPIFFTIYFMALAVAGFGANLIGNRIGGED